MAEIDIEEALGDLKDVLRPICKAPSRVTREVRPVDAVFTRLCRIVSVAGRGGIAGWMHMGAG